MAKSVGGGVPIRAQGNKMGPIKWMFLQCQTMGMMVMSSLNFIFSVIAISYDIVGK